MTTSHPTDHQHRFVRVEPVDSLEVADGVLVLYDRTVVRLTALASALVARCTEPMTEAEIADTLAADFGEPADGDLRGATRALVEELRSAGILRTVAADEEPAR